MVPFIFISIYLIFIGKNSCPQKVIMINYGKNLRIKLGGTGDMRDWLLVFMSNKKGRQ